MKTLIICNLKGGVGKTTTSINVAVGLAMQGYKVLYIDKDPQGDSSILLANNDNSLDKIDFEQISNEEDLMVSFLGTEDKKEITLSDCFDNPAIVRDAIRHTLITNLDIIPAALELSLTDTKLRLDATKPQHNRLKRILDPVKKIYDYCIIDCAPSLNLLTINAINIASSSLIIPIKVDYAALRGWAITVQFLQEIAENYSLDIDYKVLFTMANKTATGWIRAQQTWIDTFKRVLPGKVFGTVVRNQSAPVLKAGYQKGAVIQQAKTGVGQDYRDLVNEIVKESD